MTPAGVVIILGLITVASAMFTILRANIAPQLKKFWLLIIFTGVFLVTTVSSIIWALSLRELSAKEFITCVACALGFIMILAALSYATTEDKTLLIFRWCKLKLGKSIRFPSTPEEREALRRWACVELELAAETATSRKKYREQKDSALRLYPAFETRVLTDPHQLQDFRERYASYCASLAQFQKEYGSAIFEAAKAFRRYYALWDFFKAMGMLPTNVGSPWENPDTFRLSLIRPGDEAPPAETSEPELTKDTNLKLSVTQPLTSNCEDYV